MHPHELCWFWLEELAKKCGPYMKIEEIYYLIPGKSLEEGLRGMNADKRRFYIWLKLFWHMGALTCMSCI